MNSSTRKYFRIISKNKRRFTIWVCTIIILLFSSSFSYAKFKKVEDLMIGCRFLTLFQKQGSFYLAAGAVDSIGIYKWNGVIFEYYQYIIIEEDVYYDNIFTFVQNNENYFILSGPGGTDIYTWNEAGETFTHLQNIPLLIPYGLFIEHFTVNGKPNFAIPAADDKVWVYEWDGTQFAKLTDFICPGADIRSIYVNDTSYLVATFYDTPSRIYKWNGIRFMMSNDFQVPSINEQLAHSFTFMGEQFFVFFTSYFTYEQGDTFEIDKWNGDHLEKVYDAKTNAYMFDSFTNGEKQFLVISEETEEGLFEDIYEWKDNQCIPYQTIPTQNEYFTKYININGKPYLLIGYYFSFISLYEWESSDPKNISLSDVICALQILSGKQCQYSGLDLSSDKKIGMEEIIHNLTEISR